LQLANGEYDGKRIVSAKNLSETKTPHTPMRRSAEMKATYPETVQNSYAMGWVVYDYRGHAVIAHGGIIDGFRSQMVLLPDAKIGFALLNNLHNTKLNIALGNILIDRLLDLPAKDWHAYYQKLETDEAEARKAFYAKRALARDPNLKPSLTLDKYAGEYEHPAYGTATVTWKDGKLTATFSSFALPLEPWHGDYFRNLGEGILADELVDFTVRGQAVEGFTLMGLPFRKKG
jgi:hypothetical protein